MGVKLKLVMPGGLIRIGGALIILSGIVSIVISIPIGAVYYEVDPLGIFGHIGIVAGLIAILIGGFLTWFGSLEHHSIIRMIIAGIVSIVLGHAGAVAGALLVGTLGVLCCYVAGVWFIVKAVKKGFAASSITG